MRFEPFDRLPMIEWASWWSETLTRWYDEGLPRSLQKADELWRYFGLEVYRQAWCRPVHWEAPRPTAHGAGILTCMEDYERLHHHFFQVLDQWPVNMAELERWAEEQRRGEIVIWFTLDGFFWLPRTLLGIERHLYSFYDQPALLHRINRENAAWMCTVIDRICDVCTPDFMTFAEDMSYNHGPMLSKALFDEFLLPYYQMVVPRLHARGIIAIVDSDGNIGPAADWFETAGLDGVLPLERQAGVDVAALRARHPRMKWIGAFDKMVMNKGETAIRA